MADFEIRPLVPIGAGDNVHVAVAVEIPEIGALAPKLVAQLDFFERVQQIIRRRRGCQAEREDQHRQRKLEHPPFFARRVARVKRDGWWLSGKIFVKNG